MPGSFFNTIQDLITNLAIVTAYLFLASQVIFKNIKFGTPASMLLKFKIGFVSGLLGIVLMLSTVSFNGTILDFRQLAVLLAALFGGVYSAMITGLIIFLMRLFAFGSVSLPNFIAAINTIVISFSVGIIFSLHISYRMKWVYSLVVCVVFTTIAFFLNLGADGLIPALLFICMMSIGGAVTAYFTHFLIKVKAHIQRMEEDISIDFLTGLNNYRTFDLIFNKTIKNALEKNEILSLLLLDIDYFKRVNDTFGHLNGDAVLKQVAELLKNTARSFDFISRNGGEEFSIILSNCSHKDALIIADQIILAFRRHSFILNDGTNIQITISIGVASLNENADDNIIEQADLALYRAKSNGRNQICSHIGIVG
jgi:diguanylate cyclase